MPLNHDSADNLDAPLAIVTGSSRGLGLAVARLLLDAGWRVIGIARSTPADLGHANYEHVAIDLAGSRELSNWLAEDFQRHFDPARTRRLALVNNAGRLEPITPLAGIQFDELLAVLALNTALPLWLSGQLVERCANVPLRIVDISSGAATKAYPGWGAYCASKAALRLGGEVLAEELVSIPRLADRDVCVLSYAPGVVDTAMQERIRLSDIDHFPAQARFVAMHEEGQLLPPEAPAREIVAFLEDEGLPRHSARRYGDSGQESAY